MGKSDIVALGELRKLAKKAGMTLAEEEFGYRMRWHCSAYNETLTLEARSGSKMIARRKLRHILQTYAGANDD